MFTTKKEELVSAETEKKIWHPIGYQAILEDENDSVKILTLL